MFGNWSTKRISRKYALRDINPEEIFVDSENLPEYDKHQLEGRIEKPIARHAVLGVVLVFIIIGLTYLTKVSDLQLVHGQEHAERSENNRLRHTLVFADRGTIYDRNRELLAWNTPAHQDDYSDFSLRKYIEDDGFAHVLGYVKYPKKDKAGFYYNTEFNGFDGVEEFYENIIAGVNGVKIVETNALLEVVSDNTIADPENGKELVLSIDKELQKQLYNSISSIADEVGFTGGAGVIMDVETGEIYALTSYPEYDSNIMTDGSDVELIERFFNENSNRFLNRAVGGLYTPGSIMKPYVALSGLQEGVVTPYTIITSTGEMVIPNPYNPELPSIFTDWRAHGNVDVRDALAYSSNIYFYQVGGGLEATGQQGVGIANLEKYFKAFGFGSGLSKPLLNEGPSGTIPSPEWKEKTFDGDPWRLGDTYFTAIGQYGVQVTPVQVARALTGIVNKGTMVEPTLLKDDEVVTQDVGVDISESHYNTVQAGMRDVVLFGTGKGLNIPEVEVAAKTGTAELGVSKARVNSWVTGFFPYDKPKYAFVVVMEQGSRTNLIGGVAVMRRVLDWMRLNDTEYI